MMRKWFLDWAWIDVLTLGLSAALCMSFVLYRHGHAETRSGWVELWPDVGTSLFEAWLSIRIIDQLLKRREQRTSVLPRTRGNILYIFGEMISDISPKFYDWRVKRLHDELKWFEDRLPKRKRIISEKDMKPILAAFDREKTIGEAIEQYRQISDAILVAHSAVEAALARANLGNIYSEKMAWFLEVRKAYDLMQDRAIHDGQKMDTILSSSQVQSGISQADPRLVDLLRTYVERVRSASKLRTDIEGQITAIGPLLEELRREQWSDQEP